MVENVFSKPSSKKHLSFKTYDIWLLQISIYYSLYKLFYENIYMKNSTLIKLKKPELKKILSSLKLYLDLSKKLWKRWRDVFRRNLNWESKLLVEYFPSINKDIAYEKASQVYNKVFSINPSKKEIFFEEKNSILWWIKVYKDDMLVDLSFSKIERKLRN